MRALAVALLLGLPGLALAQPSGWSASIGASAPASETLVPRIEITRPVTADESGVAIARPSRACEVKPVMTDEDYRRCGARPPSYEVDFAAPWPRDAPWPPDRGDVSRRRAGG